MGRKIGRCVVCPNDKATRMLVPGKDGELETILCAPCYKRMLVVLRLDSDERERALEQAQRTIDVLCFVQNPTASASAKLRDLERAVKLAP